MQWGGDDWGADFPTTSDHHNLPSGSRKKKLNNNSDDKIEEKGSLSSSHNDLIINKANTTTTTTTTKDQVKIKITRKQLEEVLGRSNINNVQAGQGLSVQEVVAHLINVSHEFDSHQRSWRPALPTITEVN